MDYLHVKNLEEYHPGYKDRSLIWCKVHFKMLNSDHEFEMMHEIDKWRFVAFIMLELQSKKPTPLDEKYLSRKGFDFNDRSMSLTIKMLHNFIECVTDNGVKVETHVTQSRVDKSRIDKSRVDVSPYKKFSDLLSHSIIKVAPTVKITEYQKVKWCDTVRLMVEQDKRELSQIETAIRGTFKNDFWSGVIRSMDKLRKQWNEKGDFWKNGNAKNVGNHIAAKVQKYAKHGK